MKRIISLLMVTAIYMSVVAMPAADQPHMKNAKNHLNKAKSLLNKATPDKGGHRNKAMDLVERAITQVNAGMAYDVANPRDRRKKNDSDEVEYAEVSVSDQPYMQRAKDQLQDALNDLQKATPDKGGHRQNAMDLVREAIEQVDKGIAYDRKN